MNLALFDFDGTITEEEMFTKFLYFSTSKKRIFIGNCLLLPFIFLYKKGWFPAPKLRVMASYVSFFGRSHEVLNTLGAEFSHQVIPQYLRDNALKRIQWHKDQGDKVVVVSASLDLYLRHWCAQLDILLICNEIAVNKGKVTGRFVAEDCSCSAKVNQVNARFNLADYSYIYAYGDTAEDLAMLDLANEKYMNWQSVT